MNPSRLIALVVALVAFGGAFMMMNRTKPMQPVVVQTSAPPPRTDLEKVLVASKDIELGTLLTEIDVKWVDWPRASISDGMIVQSRAPKAMEDAVGSVTRGPFFANEPIRPSKIVKGPNAGFLSAILPSGSRAVAINIDASGATTAGGFILPNDRVDIVRTNRGTAQNAVSTETMMRNIRVLAIGQNVEEKNGKRVVVGSNATLELTPRQAEQIIQAQRIGQLSLVLRNQMDSSVTAAPEGEPQKPAEPQPQSLTIVRFGVPATVGR